MKTLIGEFLNNVANNNYHLCLWDAKDNVIMEVIGMQLSTNAFNRQNQCLTWLSLPNYIRLKLFQGELDPNGLLSELVRLAVN